MLLYVFLLLISQGRSEITLVGNDARKAIADGFSVTQVVCADLQPGKLPAHVEDPELNYTVSRISGPRT
jgi:hypothetical protein